MFKREMAKLVFAGKKTQTRRLLTKSSKFYKVGSLQPIQISYRQKAVGYIKILKAYNQRLSDMKPQDARAEGFENWPAFMAYLDEINKTHTMPDLIVRPTQ